jgi:hypothetical protein
MRVHRRVAGHLLLDEAPQVISNAIIGVIGAHGTDAMKRRVMRDCDTPMSRRPLASQEAS